MTERKEIEEIGADMIDELLENGMSFDEIGNMVDAIDRYAIVTHGME